MRRHKQVLGSSQRHIKVGDTIHIKGYTTDITQKVESMQIEHKDVGEAKPGDKVAIKVTSHVREHDVVYKVISLPLKPRQPSIHRGVMPF